MIRNAFLAGSLLLLAACNTTLKTPADYVNPFIGTGFHGHTYPGATMPYGAVQLSPDTRTGNWDACSGYHYSDSTLLGFSHTHLSGTGCIDLGDILIRPSRQTPLAFSHADETASPGYYSVRLREVDVLAELTATRHVGIHRYTFPKGKPATVVIDLAHSLDNERIHATAIKQTADNELSGMRSTGGWVENQQVYFVAQFSKPVEAEMEDSLRSILHFDMADGQPLVCKVALSVVSTDNARLNLVAETDSAGFNFDLLRRSAHNEWGHELAPIIVEGGTKAEMKNFYTALYHSKVVPNIVSDVNGQYRRHDMQTGELEGRGRQFSTFSTWDTFRAWHPLMTLLDTTLVGDMVVSLLNMYDSSGELPLWPLSAGETGTMIGYHSASIIADAYLKGIREGYDAEKAFEAMKASAAKNKKGVDYYIAGGYIPSNVKKESVSCLLEFAYDDWCIAQMAKALGRMADYETFITRSQHFINVFDGNTSFFRGKQADGNWEAPFDPFAIGRSYTEATAWQYRFFAPHDVQGMVQLFGGEEPFRAALDSLFSVSSEIAGELSDVTGLVGQYAHGNEPSHHMAYLYSYVGQPWKTQQRTRQLLCEMYHSTPEGIVGNEDCGQMSAWYILSSLGFYSVCPGSNEYVLTSPLFPRATLSLANGKQLLITANDPAKNTYIQSVRLNGKELASTFITYDQLMGGGTLSFTLTNRPDNGWGTTSAAAPYSYTTQPTVSVPYVTTDLGLFEGDVQAELKSVTVGATIHYTLDGTEPTEASSIYTKPLVLSATTQIKACGYKKGYAPSRTYTITATKAVLRPARVVKPAGQGVAYSYYEGYFTKVADLQHSPVLNSGIMPEPSITSSPQADHFGYRFEGYLNVPVDGIYEFSTRSDDGSVLFIDQEKVVDNDTSHAAIEATGRIPLQKGFHSYVLYYFEDYEGEHLSWGWRIPGGKVITPVPQENLYWTGAATDMTTQSRRDKEQTYTMPNPYDVVKLTPPAGKKVKNVILMIGDGMSLMHVYSAWTANRGKLNLDNCQAVGLSKTYCTDKLITDSGAGGTALATGHKTKYHAVGVDPAGKPLKSLTDLAAEKSKSTGIVVTCRLNDATPADFCCHNLDRDADYEIVADYVDCGVDFVFGGGSKYFENRPDGRNIFTELQKKGYRTPRSWEELSDIQSGKVFTVTDTTDTPVPAVRGDLLERASMKAVDLLSKDSDGFFLMIEGSQLDDYGHFNDLDMLMQEVHDFDRTIGRIFEWAARDGETLVVVTADHETGGLTLVDGSLDEGRIVCKFSTGGHSGVMVPVYSFGPGSEAFTGIFENSDIYGKIETLMNNK